MTAQTWVNSIIDDTLINNHVLLTADINNDGFEDVIIQTVFDMIYFPNNGDGTFNINQPLFDYRSTQGNSGIVTADFNNDNLVDFIGVERLLINGNLEGKLIFYKQTASGFEKIIIADNEPLMIMEIQTADMDNDNDMDLVVNYTGNEIWLYRNEGLGTFEAPILLANTAEYYGFDINDFNNDGFSDIYLLHANNLIGQNTIVLNDAMGGFLEEEILEEIDVVLYSDEFVVSSGDFNTDGFNDVVLASGADRITIQMNNGNGLSFTETQTLSEMFKVTELLTTDIDLDGDIDIITVFRGYGKIIWFENDGNGTFLPANPIFHDPSLNGLKFLSLADIDNDNVLDIVWADIFSPIAYLKTPEFLSIDDNTDNTNFKIYPNPVSSYLTINSPFDILDVTIYDMTGKEVLSIKRNNISQIDLSNLKKGVYNIKFNTDNKSYNKLINQLRKFFK